MKLKKIACFLFASMFTVVMSTTVFAEELPSDYNALVTSESVYGPGNYDENNYFQFTSGDARMSSSGGFTFKVNNSLYSDFFRIKYSTLTVFIYGNADTSTKKLNVKIVEKGTSGIGAHAYNFTMDGKTYSHRYSGLKPGGIYQLVLEPTPLTGLCEGSGYINANDWGGLA